MGGVNASSVDDYNVLSDDEEYRSTLNEIYTIIESKETMPDKTSEGETAITTMSYNYNYNYNYNVYPRRKGTILVTDDKALGVFPTGHAAIVSDVNNVVESVVDGVKVGPNNWNQSKATCYGLTVKNTSYEQDERAADYCYSKIGKEYNWNYFNTSTREKFYCSQLVWAAYKDLFNINLDTDKFGNAVQPMELVSSNNTSIIYKNINGQNIHDNTVSTRIAVYRLYDNKKDRHIFTTDVNEKNKLKNVGWQVDNTVGGNEIHIFYGSVNNGIPVFRVNKYDPISGCYRHLMTTNTVERDNCLRSGWNIDNGGRPIFYAAPNSTDSTPIYRLYQSSNSNRTFLQGKYLYTSSYNEATIVGNSGAWRWENNRQPVFYAYK